MDRYQLLFNRLAEKNEGAFVPFVTIGDPTPEQSMNIIDTLIESGADALELGIPFSDPLADGPTIQGATIRALGSGTTPAVCFDLLAQIREAKARDKTVVVGGPYATSLPDEVQAAGADFLVLDEGEVTVPPFLEALAQGQTQGIFRSTERLRTSCVKKPSMVTKWSKPCVSPFSASPTHGFSFTPTVS